jgi:hypothetical protein
MNQITAIQHQGPVHACCHACSSRNSSSRRMGAGVILPPCTGVYRGLKDCVVACNSGVASPDACGLWISEDLAN